MAGQQTRGSRTAGRADPGGDGKATRSDVAGLKSRARASEAALERAFEAGRRGDDPEQWQTDELWPYYQDGQRAAREERRRERVAQVTGGAGSVANDGAGFLLGLLAYALLANYLRGGTPAVRAWLRAKFLNRVDPGAARAERPAIPAKPAAPAAAQIRVGVG